MLKNGTNVVVNEATPQEYTGVVVASDPIGTYTIEDHDGNEHEALAINVKPFDTMIIEEVEKEKTAEELAELHSLMFHPGQKV
jgi:hypothetical protein